MNIISRIKSWFEPEVKVATTKAKVRFKNGAAINLYTPEHAGDEMKTKACGFVSVNRDLEKEKRTREEMLIRAQAAMGSASYCGAGNVGMQGQMRGNPQSLMGGNLWGRERSFRTS